MPKRAIIYVRQSFDKAGDSAGVERQERACAGLCAAREWEVVRVVTDNSVSASTGRVRPGWAQVLEAIKKGEVDVVVAWHLDRITRTMRDLEDLIELTQPRGVGVATATGDIDLTTDVGRMVARILAAVARAEVERKGERQVLSNEQRVSKGAHRWARRPFGYSKDGTLLEAEARLLRQGYAMILAGARTARVRDAWTAAGSTTTTGGAWSTQTVGQLLRDPRNAGIIVYRGEEAGTGSWEPVIDETTFRVVAARLSGKRRHRGPAGRSGADLVTVARCGGCSGPVFATNRPDGWRYSCANGCIWLPTDWADGRVFLELAEILSDPLRKAQWEHLAAERTEEGNELRAELALLTERMGTMADDYADGLLTREQMLKGTTRARERAAELEARMTELGVDGGGPVWDAEWFAEVVSVMGVDERRELLRSLTDRIVLHPRNRKHGLWPELVEVVPRNAESPHAAA